RRTQADTHRLHQGGALRAPYPTDAEALCRASGSDGSRLARCAGETPANRFTAGRNALDLAVARPTVGSSAGCAHAGRGHVRRSTIGLDGGARWRLGLACQFHEYCLSGHRRNSRKAYLAIDMTVAVTRPRGAPSPLTEWGRELKSSGIMA